MLPLVFVGAAVVTWLAGHAYSHRVLRRVMSRYERNSHGIIRGAEGFEEIGSNGAAVLLIHGCGDTPQTMRHVGDELRRRGYSVAAPLLPGHGRDLAAFNAHTADDWYDAVTAAYDRLRRTHEWVGVLGLSMGGALAARLTAERGDVGALALASPYFVMPRRGDLLSRTGMLWGPFIPVLDTSTEASVLDPEARAASLGYGAFTPHSLKALRVTALRGLFSLAEIQTPTLIVQSRRDNRISADVTERAFGLLDSSEKELHWIENAGHVITVDRGWEQVVGLVAGWMEAHRAKPGSERHIDAPISSVPGS